MCGCVIATTCVFPLKHIPSPHRVGKIGRQLTTFATNEVATMMARSMVVILDSTEGPTRDLCYGIRLSIIPLPSFTQYSSVIDSLI